MLKQVKYLTKVAIFKTLSGQARAAFEKAPTTPEWLDREEMERLRQKYPVKISQQKYEDDANALFTTPNFETADQIISFFGGSSKTLSTLELGCQHGMASYALRMKGHKPTAIDIDSENFSPVAKDAGVDFYHMDASNLAFEDESFDCVFSYNAFEHMDRPEKALEEAARVTKKGGYVYFNFNPLYMSPWGLHSWMELAVPYCQMLFTPDMIRSVVESQHLWYCNGWSCHAYRELWQKFSDRLSIIKYKENIDPFHLDIVKKYPSCFRSKTDCFDDLVVDGIEVLFQKK